MVLLKRKAIISIVEALWHRRVVLKNWNIPIEDEKCVYQIKAKKVAGGIPAI